MFREERFAVRPLRKFWLGLGALALGFLLVVQAEAARGQLTPEEYVRQQAAKGEWADLNQLGEKDEDRTLSACFLEALLTGAYKVHRNGVMITNAIIPEPLDLKLAEISYVIAFQSCRFTGDVSIRDAVFAKHFLISGSHFEKAADFQRLKVKLSFFCSDTIFQGPVNFTAANIEGQFIASGAKFQGQGKDNKANFNGLKVGKDAIFDQAIFQGPVDFGYANIEGVFNANGAKFQGQGKVNEANFAGLKLGQNAFFVQAIFQGPVDFTAANIEDEFSAKGAQFQGQGPDNLANFNSLKVGRLALFENAIFQGPVNFTAANIEGGFSAKGAQFQGQGPDNQAIFNSLKVGQHALFENAIFQGPVDFSTANIEGQFIATSAKFQGRGDENKAIFYGLKVEQDAFFDQATFHGPVNFIAANIEGRFSAEGAKFLSETSDFEGMRVGKVATFSGLTFHHDVDLSYGNFLDLYLQGGEADDVRLSLTGTLIQRELKVENLNLLTLEAGHLRVKGPAKFQNLVIRESADFQNAALEKLEFKNITWPVEQKKLHLDGLTYTSICVDKPDNYQGLLNLVERSAFFAQNYVQLEEYCTKVGHPKWTDKVYIAGKQQELSKSKKNWLVKGLTYIFWDKLTGYGREPFRAFGLGLFIILIGAVRVFDPRYLKKEVQSDWHLTFYPSHLFFSRDIWNDLKNRNFSRFLASSFNLGKLVLLRILLSLEQFIPGISLKIVENWQPPKVSFPTWCWLKFQLISGWVLIPIGLAAIASQIK